ncbi:MAG: RtcB family protein [Sinobacteraceae bacterium]|nr:RtcB family protein [Nevskiaceae bacterium]
MPIAQTITKGRVPVQIWTDDIEHSAFEQLLSISQLPIIHHHVAAMPDVHFGIGATVGSVIPTLGAIIPSAVGVDIGCGMNAVRLSLRADALPDSLREVRTAIEKAIPAGFNAHDSTPDRSIMKALESGVDRIVDGAPKLGRNKSARDLWSTACGQLGTLGGGNHFIELCLDENGAVWIMLHSGSRGVGNQIGRYFIDQAKEDCAAAGISVPNRDLSYLLEGTQHYDDYCRAVSWAQEYAWRNRQVMLRLLIGALRGVLPPFELTSEAVNCHHNYVSLGETHFGRSVHVTRKGAISARLGELGIIPGSMGTRSYIVRGKGNADSFCSCSHGAGRKLPRGKASETFTEADIAVQTAGVECRKDRGVADEAPAAYKDIDVVMAHQSDLVEIVHTLKQVVCVKG